MRKPSLFLIPPLLISFFCLLVLVHGIESPQFTVIHSESNFEVRFYRESSWMSASVPGSSFEEATKQGFHRLYQYIHGGNINSTRLMMTAPVLTSIIPVSSDYTVRYYLSEKRQASPPLPNPELNLQLANWENHCIAVRKFSGFAKDENISKEADSLVSEIGRSRLANSTFSQDEYGYTIAQYNASFHTSDRLNEVWMDVVGYASEGCPSDQGNKEHAETMPKF